MLDVYMRHRTDVQDIQGMRDDGVDILLRYKDSESEHAVGLQIKSYAEIEASKSKEKRPVFYKTLKAQYSEAIERI